MCIRDRSDTGQTIDPIRNAINAGRVIRVRRDEDGPSDCGHRESASGQQQPAPKTPIGAAGETRRETHICEETGEEYHRECTKGKRRALCTKWLKRSTEQR